MQIKDLSVKDTGHETICNSFLITELKSFQELIYLFEKYCNEHKDSSILLTLDDLNQTLYTSMHTIMSYDLDNTDEYDLSSLDPKAFENGEHIGYLSTTSEFFIRKENFQAQIKEINFQQICNNSLTLTDQEIDIIEKMHDNPIKFIDNQVILNIVPVKEPYLSICAIPNGYFTGDLNPFENYALAKHMYEEYEYKLFGIGADFIGFKRMKVLSKEKENKLLKDLANLYNLDFSNKIIQKYDDFLKKYDYLFIRYTESIEHYIT